MIVKRELCKLCNSAFTVYGSRGCSVIRLEPTTKRRSCRFVDHVDTKLICPALYNTAELLYEAVNWEADRPRDGPVQLSKNDQRVYAALTEVFATSADIALRAKLPSRTRAKRAELICGKLVRHGLAEIAQSRTQPLWRLKLSVLTSHHNESMWKSQVRSTTEI
jgi:hypothetical protein